MSFDPALLLLFVYNRPSHTRRTLKALAHNKGAKDVSLVVFSDGPREESDADKVKEVRRICKHINGFREVQVVEREENLGLAASILQGVGEGLTQKDRVMVMEDDLLTHPAFMTYMNGALEAYAGQESILSVSAYLPPRFRMPRPRKHRQDVWLNRRPMSWGWGCWKEKWETVNWAQAEEDRFIGRQDLQSGFAHGGADLPGMLTDQLEGRINSWAVRFAYAHYRRDCYSLLPVESYVKPIGFDGSGMHCRPNPTRWFESTKRAIKHPVFPDQPEVDQNLNRALRKSFDRHHQLAQKLGIQ
ncbi:glycosyltransferase [Kiritimatiellaeota bacterium B1221]|nr:glycosyltransferase [Kiritimatiellaeota bacterium B1221]